MTMLSVPSDGLFCVPCQDQWINPPGVDRQACIYNNTLFRRKWLMQKFILRMALGKAPHHARGLRSKICQAKGAARHGLMTKRRADALLRKRPAEVLRVISAVREDSLCLPRLPTAMGPRLQLLGSKTTILKAPCSAALEAGDRNASTGSM